MTNKEIVVYIFVDIEAVFDNTLYEVVEENYYLIGE